MNRHTGVKSFICLLTVAWFAWATGAYAAITTITPSQDNSVAEEFPDRSAGGATGAGDTTCESLFSGTTDNQANAATLRRALLQFDLSSIPAGSTINSVTLTMRVSRGGNHADVNFSLHSLEGPWDEGTNDCPFRGGGQLDDDTAADGVTWNTLPTYGAASASTVISTSSPVWSSAAMVNDIEDWLDGTRDNYGWILIGDEGNPTTALRFDSRAGGSPPELVVDFTPVGNTEACCAPDGSCSLTLVGSGTCTSGGTPQGDGTTCEPNLCPQPSGACCNADNTCSVEFRDVCEGAGGSFEGGNCNQVDCGLTPFVEALPVPPILASDGTNAQGHPTYTISVEEAVQSVHPELPDTNLWTYNGAWPSSTIVATKGEPIQVTYVNNLPPIAGGKRGENLLEVDTCAHGPNDWGNARRISTHLHGAHVPARFDGQPEYTILPGESDVYQYPNNQDAGTVWYHDHALGITRLNVYSGMAGFYLIRDDVDTLGINPGPNALNLPNAVDGNEIGLAVQDRTFDADGSLFYNAQLEDAFKGEYAVVNGKINPYLEVRQGKYRFRLLNGSQSREYIYRLENTSGTTSSTTELVHPVFTLIGSDLGLIAAPIELGTSTGTKVGPAERLDVVIDFEGYQPGTEIILKNDDPTEPLLPSIMKFIVTDQLGPGHTDQLPSQLRAVDSMPDGSEVGTRYFRLAKSAPVACKDGSGRMVTEWLIESLDGAGGAVTGKHWDDVTEYPVLGTREIWEFENPTSSYHPMHVHLVRFQILDKHDLNTGLVIPLQPWEENAWKDIVYMPPNSKARIIMDFEDYAGRFPNHCHLLDHEDHEMMRQFQASYDPANCNNDGNCDLGEDCVSCPGDCAEVSGAFCGNGLCEAGDGEDCVTCAADCAGKAKGPFCCGNGGKNPIGCGVDASDDRCIDPRDGLACRVTPRLSACCGDAMCEGQEDVQGPDFCQVDCDPQQACVPDEPIEVSCFDGNDNDCDLAVDCSDTDCDGTVDPATTTCGVGACESTGNLSCSGGAEVDSCTPGTPGVEGPVGDASCSDGVDNDCDGLTDIADPDCSENILCVDIPDKGTCNNDSNCEWIGGPKNGSCFPTSTGVCTDIDGDGYGDPGDPVCSGGAPLDCDDNNAAVNPGASEGPEGALTCSDGLDNNCDGNIDAADPACQPPVDCSVINDKPTCNDEPACKWQGSPQNGSCNPA